MAAFGQTILSLITSMEVKYRNARLLLIAVLCLLVYSNTFNVPFSFDDETNLQNNPLISNLTINGIKTALHSRRAFGVFTFQLNYFFANWDVFWFHFTNLTIHLSTALTLYYFIILLLKTPYAKRTACCVDSTSPLPFFVTLLFAVHPIQTQAVTYIVQRFASLAALLYLAAIVSYLKMRLIQEASSRYITCHTINWFFILLLVSILAFKTKETTYTLPLVIIMVEFLFFNLSWSKFAKIAASTAALAAIFASGYLAVGRSFNTVISMLDETTRVQTITSRTDYLFTQFRVIVTYIRLIFLPINQSVDYDLTLSHSFFEWRVFSSFLVILLLNAAAVWMIWKSRAAHSQLRFIAFGILWFFLTLSIESSFIPIIDLIFEHRVYLPSVGAIIAIVAGVLIFWHRNELLRQKICLVVIIISLLLGMMTWKRNRVWQSEISLWEDATSKYPLSARGWNNLGGAYIKERKSLEALKALTRSIELDPSKADAWNNVSIAIDIMGVYNDRFHRTIEMFTDPTAVEGKIVKRWLGEVYNNLGLAYEILGNMPKAVENYRNAVGYDPALSLAYYNLGLVSATIGDISQYSEQMQILMMLDPDLAKRLLLRTGKR